MARVVRQIKIARDELGDVLPASYLFSAEGTAVGARRLRPFNARLPTGYG